MVFLKANELVDEEIAYGFFSRNGGFSKKPYDSLNCSYNSGDDKQVVSKNILLAQKQLDLHKLKIKFIKQTHSTNIKIINSRNIFKICLTNFTRKFRQNNRVEY